MAQPFRLTQTNRYLDRIQVIRKDSGESLSHIHPGTPLRDTVFFFLLFGSTCNVVCVVSLLLHFQCCAAMADKPKSLAELVADSRRVLRDRISEDDPSDERIGKFTVAAMKATRDARAAKDRTSHFANYAALSVGQHQEDAGSMLQKRLRREPEQSRKRLRLEPEPTRDQSRNPQNKEG